MPETHALPPEPNHPASQPSRHPQTGHLFECRLTFLSPISRRRGKIDSHAAAIPWVLDPTWNRIWDWQSLSSQLGLLMSFHDSQEGFFDMAYGDPVLRPAFAWISKRRNPDFDAAHFGSTLSTGETTCFVPVLIEQLLDTPKTQRYECFSRLFAKIAATNKTKAEQDSAGQPATRSESK